MRLLHNIVYLQDRAAFTRDISLRFTSYVKQAMMLELGYEELEIAKMIFDISSARYNNGTISRGLMLQSKIDYETIKIKNEALRLASITSYYELLKFAGIDEEIELDTEYTFVLNIKNDLTNSPDLKVLQTSQDKFSSEAILHLNKISWMSVFAEYESEPEQDITRVGINFPLAFFNDKTQERTIAMLKSSATELLINNEIKKLQLDNKRLKQARIFLKKQNSANKSILDDEMELLKMFQDGYKIANINLLQLQDIKNKIVSTKRNLINIKIALDNNAIITNYNKGEYND